MLRFFCSGGGVAVKISPSLEQKQTLKTGYSLRQRQALEILQKSAWELEEYLQKEVLENPLLEWVEGEENGELAEEEIAAGEKEEEADWLDYFADSSDLGIVWERDEEKRELYSPLPPTLQEYLLSQLGLLSLTGEETKIARYLIGNIDERGYLSIGLEEAAKVFCCAREKVEAVLKKVQSLDPPGVGARDLTECLLLQAERKGFLDKETTVVIRHYLQELATKGIKRVAQLSGLPPERVQEIVDRLRQLNPWPGKGWGGSSPPSWVVPEVIVCKEEGEKLLVLLEDQVGPRLRISSYYREIMARENSPDLRRYFQQKLRAALWLLRCIEQRRRTLYRIAQALVKLQKPFFLQGPQALKPLTLKEVAAETGLHESTVSRALQGKYMQTPFGVFAMKSLLSSALEVEEGEAVSVETAQKMLRELIAGEDPARPYSDRQLANLLAERGIKIARRTVAKYREEMGIPAAPCRRRYQQKK